MFLLGLGDESRDSLPECKLTVCWHKDLPLPLDVCSRPNPQPPKTKPPLNPKNPKLQVLNPKP